jgi:hypothetical protein
MLSCAAARSCSWLLCLGLASLLVCTCLALLALLLLGWRPAVVQGLGCRLGLAVM